MISAAALTTLKASEVAKQQGDLHKQARLIKQAAEYWALNGDIEKYGETLAKAAKVVGNQSNGKLGSFAITLENGVLLFSWKSWIRTSRKQLMQKVF